jgi:hypothetical protein
MEPTPGTIALGRVAPTALHEIASGIAGLGGLIELLALDAEPGTETAGHLATAQETVDSLRALLRALSEVASDPDLARAVNEAGVLEIPGREEPLKLR